MNYSEFQDELKNIAKAAGDLERIHQFAVNLELAQKNNTGDDQAEDFSDVITKMKNDLANDFNVPGAMAHFFSLVRQINKDYLSENNNYSNKKKLHSQTYQSIKEVMSFVKASTGCLYDQPEKVLSAVNEARKKLNANAEGADQTSLSDEQVEKLLVDRKQARADKDWAKSDEIRDQLKAAKIVVKDNPDGTTTWKHS